ncbi:hypothetical protein MHBO_002715 [Bonamia ostreae]|uniref:Uncharacterized protein n=1 Tax=Bonamia ostreae TaxID=126728 RepID=A0ABV2AN93_9EUKA
MEIQKHAIIETNPKAFTKLRTHIFEDFEPSPSLSRNLRRFNVAISASAPSDNFKRMFNNERIRAYFHPSISTVSKFSSFSFYYGISQTFEISNIVNSSFSKNKNENNYFYGDDDKFVDMLGDVDNFRIENLGYQVAFLLARENNKFLHFKADLSSLELALTSLKYKYKDLEMRGGFKFSKRESGVNYYCGFSVEKNRGSKPYFSCSVALDGTIDTYFYVTLLDSLKINKFDNKLKLALTSRLKPNRTNPICNVGASLNWGFFTGGLHNKGINVMGIDI